MAEFTHLHLHTLYSLLDGAIRMKDLIKGVQAAGMKSVAVTDHGNMFGTIDFYKKAKEAGIKPILGYEAYVAGPKGMKDRTERVANHLILLAENEEGYRNLRTLASFSYLDGMYYHPRVDKQLLKQHSKGLFALTACLAGEVTGAAARGDMDNARRAASEFKEIFEPGHLFLEVQGNGLAEQKVANDNIKQLSRDLDIPLCATADSHYLKREDAAAHEILMCIASGKKLEDAKRLKHETDQLYLKTPDDILRDFADTPEAVHNSVLIADRCNVELKLGKPMLPTFKVPEGFTTDEFMAKLAREGLDKRFGELIGRVHYPINKDLYRARLEMEIGVIQKMGFAGYFLIVQDFINWAKRNGVPVGPGRGSGAGSLVAYSLRITDLDPIPYNLLFERFLNPERVSMPDFDVDFCQDKRERVIKYVTERYGKENVGQIITFGQLKARSVIKDVVRVMGLPFSEGDRISKLVPEVLNITLKEAIWGNAEKGIAGEPRLLDLYDHPQQIATVDGKPVDTKQLLDIAIALEGLNRQAGMHAAGVVIGDEPLWNYVPVYRPSGEDIIVTQFAKDEVELAGLVKFDFLGLKTLTVIQHAVDLINRNHPELPEPVTPEKIPLDDKPSYDLISRGDTAGIFQMESSGFTEMVRRMKPSRFEDVIAAGALYRPGPLDQKLDDGRTMVDVYIDRKHGKEKVAYPHPKLQPVLDDTYGVIVYQEQVMQISQVLGGYSLGRADLLRRAMGKKKAEVMAKEREGFLEGCKKTGVDLKVADSIFSLMEKFAQYGFNKSHSAAYALITIQTAWLKAHYPVEFMAALLTSEKDNTDKVVRHIGEARADGIDVLPPDVNESELSFGASNGKIRFGLGGIKGVGETAIEAIVEARQSGPFKGMSDFCERVDSRRVNKKCLEALIKSGAFDFEKQPRRRLFEAIDRVVERGTTTQREKASGQSSLFGLMSSPQTAQTDLRGLYGNAEEWTEKEKLANEKEAMGFYVSGHPLDQYIKELSRYAKSTSVVQQMRDGEKVTVAGVVAALRERPTKTGKRMAFITLEDTSGIVEVICFPGGGSGGPPEEGNRQRGPRPGFDVWEPKLKTDEPILITGKVQVKSMDDGNRIAELIAEEVKTLAEVREKRAKRLRIAIAAEKVDNEKLQKLKAELEKNPGPLPVMLEFEVDGQATAEIAVGLKVKVSDELISFADRLFGSKCAEVS
jgi:DNA polymerase-3 subunit alpha